MPYRQELKIKVTKITHVVSFGEGYSAVSLKEYLAKVPDEARIVEIMNIEDSPTVDHEIWFEEEKEGGKV